MICAKTTYLEYAAMIICPPMFVAMRKGAKGWIYIIIDTVLTLFFYFPGLIYAILVTNRICPSDLELNN